MAGKVFFEFIAENSKFRKSVSEMRKDLFDFKKNASALGGYLATGLKVGVGAAVAGLAAVGVEAVAAMKTFASFDLVMRRVASVTGSTEKDLSEIEDVINDVAVATKFTIADLASAARVLGEMGAKKDDIKSLLPVVGDLATAIGVDTEPAASLLLSTLKSMRVSVKDIDAVAKVSDTLSVAANNSALNFDKLSTALGVVGPAAGTTGQSLDEVVLTLGNLVSQGVDASTAGTAVRNALVRLSKAADPTARGAEEISNGLAELGLSADDVNLKTNTLSQIWQKLAKRGADTTSLIKIFGAEFGLTTKSIIDGMQPGTEAATTMEELGTALSNVTGKTMQYREEAMKGFGPALQLARGSFDLFQKEIGKGIVQFLSLDTLFKGLSTSLGRVAQAIKGVTDEQAAAGKEGNTFAEIWDMVNAKIIEGAEWITMNRDRILDFGQSIMKATKEWLPDFIVNIQNIVEILKDMWSIAEKLLIIPASFWGKKILGLGGEKEASRKAAKEQIEERRRAILAGEIRPSTAGEFALAGKSAPTYNQNTIINYNQRSETGRFQPKPMRAPRGGGHLASAGAY